MAILYDFIEVAGGAEKVSVELSNALNRPLIVGGVNKEALNILPHIENQIITLGSTTKLPVWKSIKSVRLFENIDSNLLTENKILFSGSNSPLAIHKSSARKNYYYCHTPPRFAYDLYDYYQETLPIWQGMIVKRLALWFKERYEPAINRMDHIFANSINVQNRLKKHLNLDSSVIYPPVDIIQFWNETENGYYLSTARLEEYKRVELIVEAFKFMPDKQLVMVSGGSLYNKLKKTSCQYKNIKIVGWVNQTQLNNYIAQSIATIYIPIDEDFGMSPIESMAAGKPVIGVAEGGVRETVLDGETGFFIPKNPIKEDIIDAVTKLSANAANKMKTACINRANEFKPDIFFTKFKEIML